MNAEDYDDFKAWDGFTPSLDLGPSSMPYSAITLGGARRKKFRMPGASSPRTVEARAYKIDQYAFTDDRIRRIKLSNFGYLSNSSSPVDESVRIKAWYKLADGRRVTEDWTDLNEVTFCRSNQDEDIKKLVLFYVNGKPTEYLGHAAVEFPHEDASIEVANRCGPSPGMVTGSLTIESASTGSSAGGSHDHQFVWNIDANFVAGQDGAYDDSGSSFTFSGHRNSASISGSCTVHRDVRWSGGGAFDSPSFLNIYVPPEPSPDELELWGQSEVPSRFTITYSGCVGNEVDDPGLERVSTSNWESCTAFAPSSPGSNTFVVDYEFISEGRRLTCSGTLTLNPGSN